MSTPYTFLAGWIKTVVASFWFVWLSTLIVSRIYVFHQAYVSETQKRADERYLLDKCNDPEFYSNIRQHTEICTHVAENAKSSLILKALHLMSQTTYLCGDRACAEVVRTTLARLTWQAAVSLGFLALIFPNALLAFSRLLGQKRYVLFLSSQTYEYTALPDGF